MVYFPSPNFNTPIRTFESGQRNSDFRSALKYIKLMNIPLLDRFTFKEYCLSTNTNNN